MDATIESVLSFLFSGAISEKLGIIKTDMAIRSAVVSPFQSVPQRRATSICTSKLKTDSF
jgi:hypothetical protein